MNIRDISYDDQNTFMQLCNEFYSSDATLFGFDGEAAEKTFREAVTGNPMLRILMIENDEEQVVGYSIITCFWSNEAGGIVVLLDELYIRASERGKQLGSGFLAWLQDTYRDKAKAIRLEICKSNTGAIRLYKRYQFEELEYGSMIYSM